LRATSKGLISTTAANEAAVNNPRRVTAKTITAGWAEQHGELLSVIKQQGDQAARSSSQLSRYFFELIQEARSVRVDFKELIRQQQENNANQLRLLNSLRQDRALYRAEQQRQQYHLSTAEALRVHQYARGVRDNHSSLPEIGVQRTPRSRAPSPEPDLGAHFHRGAPQLPPYTPAPPPRSVSPQLTRDLAARLGPINCPPPTPRDW
jgi:hypothetical protein